MDDNSKKFKLNFVTLFLFLAFAILAIGGIFVVKNKTINNSIYKNTIKNNSIMSNNVANTTKGNTIKNYEITDFVFDFLKLENNKSNMIYSPLSIKYALNMLNDGAEGNTKTQIEKVLRNEKVTKYSKINNTLSLANGIFIRDSFAGSISPSYIQLLKNDYDAQIEYDSFKNARNINNWIEEETLGQIKDMVSDNSVTDPNNRMILVNALAIDMEWENKFDCGDTIGSEFYLENGESIIATTMNQDFYYGDTAYYKDNEITALSMNLKEYKNEQFEFIAIMPDKDLSTYINNFGVDELNSIISKLITASDAEDEISVYIPRFSYEYDLSLKNDLIAMGIKDAFDLNLANFDAMSKEKQLYVGDALHKANIDFSEEGVKAAAVTALGMNEAMAAYEEEKIEIVIDKPFIYVIRDKDTNEIWFVGSVYKPNLWEDDRDSYTYSNDYSY